MEHEGTTAIVGWVAKSHTSDCARGAEDSEADATLVSDIKNSLHDVLTSVNVDDDKLHGGLNGLGH